MVPWRKTRSLAGVNWRFDWRYEGFQAVMGPPADPVQVHAQAPAGTFTKQATVVPRVVLAGLTLDDPRTAWPTPDCDPAVLKCLRLHADAPDFGACGAYYDVRRCVSQL